MNGMNAEPKEGDIFIGKSPDKRVADWEFHYWYRPSNHGLLYRCGEGFLIFVTHGGLSNPKCCPDGKALLLKHLGLTEDQFDKLQPPKIDS